MPWILIYRSVNPEDRREFLPFTFLRPGAVIGANLALRKTVLRQTGGYDERLGAGMPFASEDTDLAAAVLWSGAMGVHDPRPVVYHHHGRRTNVEYTELLKYYYTGDGAYYAKYVLRPRLKRDVS